MEILKIALRQACLVVSFGIPVFVLVVLSVLPERLFASFIDGSDALPADGGSGILPAGFERRWSAQESPYEHLGGLADFAATR